ncbi:DNA-3-methyladenine glycosylase I [Neiella marina]|uniref:DNA-3-methyladenine glycosylase I n=1 Tax=Neiella holothuriorum TaxID=2870530 RepID=A0ABS7EIP6_9GAMM|nr:DNA-3-methyladenine glycosylase I [Neiella holothuriorum]MBW8192095.1 DNA-3-methyladenine glycosylase I [Neiella holothuriorum]
MEHFSHTLARAIERKGGEQQLFSLLTSPVQSHQLQALTDADCLAQITKVVFQSGFAWRVIEHKWAGFEKAFWQFDPNKLVLLDDSHIERLMQNTDIVRNGQKIKTVPINAQLMLDIRQQHGSFGQFLAEWPEQDITGLWLYLKKHGARLGGNSASFVLRRLGKDTFVLSRDVTAHLINQGVIDKPATSKTALKQVQQAFNTWQQQVSLPLTQLSQIIALSVGSNERHAE